MSVMLTYQVSTKTLSQTIVLDASVKEMHTTSTEVTDHQVEKAPSIVDYIRPLPRKISIEGVVTNTPITAPPDPSRGVTATQGKTTVTVGGNQISADVLKFSDQFDRVRDVYGDLVEACLNGALFTIDTTLASYENFAITSFAVPRDAQSGSSIQFTIELMEVRIVESKETTALAPSKKQAKKQRGNKPTSEVDDKDKKKSVLKSVVNSVSAAFGK
jgi:hypothetical protein